jgi:hypothetical protein
MGRKLNATFERMSRLAVARHSQRSIEMKFIRIAMALAVTGIIAGTSALLADTPVTPAEAEKIKAVLEAWGCTGGFNSSGSLPIFSPLSADPRR